MARSKPGDEPSALPENYPPPASTLEGREDQLIAAAMNLVERRIYDGTASAQETVHFLKLGSVRNKLEEEKIRQDRILQEARVLEMQERKGGEGRLEEALQPFRGYSGQVPTNPEDDGYGPDLY